MDRNITQETDKTTMTWYDAMDYIRANNLKTNWKNVIDIDLPIAQTIANAVGNTSWKMTEKDYTEWFNFDKNGNSYGQTQVANASNPSNYQWLFNYTRECTNYGCDSSTSLDSTEAYGYWTRDVVANQVDSTGRAWSVLRDGKLNSAGLINETSRGVRPVITLLESNLYE